MRERNNNDVSVQVREWVEHCTRYLDFLWGREEDFPPLTVQEALQGPAQLKICDPFGYILDPPLCNRIESVETASGKVVSPESCCGKLTVRLKTGEELTGKFVDGGREGPGAIIGGRLEKLGISSIFGNYESGVLSGRGKVIMTDGSTRDGTFQDGYFHGPCRGSFNSIDINFLGNYRAGLPSGVVWSRVRGGAWIVGQTDDQGDLTGENIAYLYPDFSTAIFGEFRKGMLVRGKAARVTGLGECCSEYRHWPSTNTQIFWPQHLRDPYEATVLEVRQSNIQGSGEGAFALRDIPPDTIVAFYNGIKMKENEKTPYEDSGYAIYVEFAKRNSHNGKKGGEHMDLPPDYQSFSQYSATSAHKLNHSFTPNCAWDNIIHPCLGLVPCVRTLEEIKMGAELTVHYMMDMEEAPEWYQLCWGQHYNPEQ